MIAYTLSAVELRQLRYLVALADGRSFTRAAAASHVAQPALSQQVRRLEAELGVTLVDRSRRPVALTPAGESLVARARRALGEIDAGIEEVADIRGARSGRVLVGAMQSLGAYDLPGVVAAFHARHPGVDVLVREESSEEMLRMVAADELDLAFASLDEPPPAGLSAHVLTQEAIVAIVARGHRLAGRRRLPVGALRDEPFVYFKPGSGLRRITDAAAAAAGFAPLVRFESNELDRVRALVARGLGVALVPASTAAAPGPEVAALPLSPPLRRTIGLVVREARNRAPAAEAFVGHVLAGAEPG
jgi:DNA-binding transcriptional LysR family regulator